jgi:pyruvate/2-oxoglutarate dehydrogenase complex dihydrolipoamide dehydrogenase (E3) component
MLYKAPWGVYTITVELKDGTIEKFSGEALLNAAGRAPNVHDIGLDLVNLSLLVSPCIY